MKLFYKDFLPDHPITFYPNVINVWNKLDCDIPSSASYSIFFNVLLRFIRVIERNTFTINDSITIKFLGTIIDTYSIINALNSPCHFCIEAEIIRHFFQS